MHTNWFTSNVRRVPTEEQAHPPLYAQLEEVVRERIESEAWPAGTRLPSERDLCEEFGLSRSTTRTALDRLERAGLIRRLPRKGAVVLAKKSTLKALSLQSFTDQVLEAGASASSKLIRFERVLPSAQVRAQLGLNEGQLVHSFERLRHVDGQPVALHHSYLPLDTAPDLEEADLVSQSLYTVLARRYGIEIGHASEALQSTLATNYESALLDVSPGAPMLQLSITLSTEAGVAIEFVRAVLRGDRVTLTAQI